MAEKIKISEKEIEEKVKFLSSVKCNHTQHMYIDITDDLVQGTLLARIMYWFSVDKNKKSKVRIFKDGYFWIAKQRKNCNRSQETICDSDSDQQTVSIVVSQVRERQDRIILATVRKVQTIAPIRLLCARRIVNFMRKR